MDDSWILFGVDTEVEHTETTRIPGSSSLLNQSFENHQVPKDASPKRKMSMYLSQLQELELMLQGDYRSLDIKRQKDHYRKLLPFFHVSSIPPAVQDRATNILRSTLYAMNSETFNDLLDFVFDRFTTQEDRDTAKKIMLSVVELLPTQHNAFDMARMTISCWMPRLMAALSPETIQSALAVLALMKQRFPQLVQTTGANFERIGEFVCCLDKVLGSGSFATVYLGYHVIAGNKVAIKQLNWAGLTKNNPKIEQVLTREIEIMKHIVDDHIVRLYDVIRQGNYVYLVLEYCSGGSLEELLSKESCLSEERTQQYCVQIVKALQSLRNRNILHRDLKPGNILFHAKEKQVGEDGKKDQMKNNMDEIIVKLTDFTFARYVNDQEVCQTLCGSPLYMAPEMPLEKRYTDKSDLWSLGVVLYQMLCGSVPIKGDNIHELFMAMKDTAHRQIRLPDLCKATGNPFSPACRHLIEHLLQRDPSKRLPWFQLFHHPWLESSFVLSSTSSSSTTTTTTTTTNSSTMSSTTTSSSSSSSSSPQDRRISPRMSQQQTSGISSPSSMYASNATNPGSSTRLLSPGVMPTSQDYDRLRRRYERLKRKLAGEEKKNKDLEQSLEVRNINQRKFAEALEHAKRTVERAHDRENQCQKTCAMLRKEKDALEEKFAQLNSNKARSLQEMEEEKQVNLAALKQQEQAHLEEKSKWISEKEELLAKWTRERELWKQKKAQKKKEHLDAMVVKDATWEAKLDSAMKEKERQVAALKQEMATWKEDCEQSIMDCTMSAKDDLLACQDELKVISQVNESLTEQVKTLKDHLEEKDNTIEGLIQQKSAWEENEAQLQHLLQENLDASDRDNKERAMLIRHLREIGQAICEFKKKHQHKHENLVMGHGNLDPTTEQLLQDWDRKEKEEEKLEEEEEEKKQEDKWMNENEDLKLSQGIKEETKDVLNFGSLLITLLFAERGILEESYCGFLKKKKEKKDANPSYVTRKDLEKQNEVLQNELYAYKLYVEELEEKKGKKSSDDPNASPLSQSFLGKILHKKT